jgi:AraC-like DNA-binding protein
MRRFSTHCDADVEEFDPVTSAGLSPLKGVTSSRTMLHHRDRVSKKSAFVLQVLRQKARARRNKQATEFYSIREVANHFGVPATTVSRMFTQLKSEGLLTTVWGSKTVVAPTRIDNRLRMRAVVGLPASLGSFCTLRQYRSFFSGIRETLWKFGFATQLIFYEGHDMQSPTFAERLLKHNVDVVIWFLPAVNAKEAVARLLDRGILVITVAESARDCREHLYKVDYEPAIRDGLLKWRKNGIRFVTILQNSRCRSCDAAKTLEKCLRDTAMQHVFADVKSLQWEQAVGSRAEQGIQGVIFACAEVAVPFVTRDPAHFTKLLRQSRILVLDGLIDVPGMCESLASCDVVEVDAEPIAKRIVSDLVQSIRPRNPTPVIFQAKWLPAAGLSA